MPLVKFHAQPGVNREGTVYAAENQYYASEKVRFRSGFPEKIGGWIRYSANQFIGTARALINWVSLSGENILGIGTHKKYYTEIGGTFTDITPIRATTTGTALFAATNGSSVVVVTDTGHGCLDGDYVTFTLAATLGGVVTATVLNKEYAISYLTVNTYSITVSVTANGSDTGNGGASTVAKYQINIGLDTYVSGVGWGAGPWGSGTWGTSITASSGAQLRLWGHDTFGEDLVFNVRGGGAYYWDTSGGGRGVTLASLGGASQAPTLVNQILVSQRDRHVIAFGCNNLGGSGAFDPLQIRWSDAESAAIWQPLATNSAGDLRIATGSQIMAAMQTRQEILVWTDSALHSLQYVGDPFVFGIGPLGTASIMGPLAAINVNGVAFWMGLDKFYTYAGMVQTLACTLRQYVFDDLNLSQAWQIFTGTVEAFNEVWWFYPSANSTTIDRYVVFNYVENLWYYGTIARTAWLDSHLRTYPLAADYNNRILLHEYGLDDVSGASAAAISSYVESGDTDIDDGDHFSFVRRILPDVNFLGSSAASPSVDITLIPRRDSGAAYQSPAAKTVTASALSPTQLYTDQVDIRIRGRQAKFRIESTGLGTQWQLGLMRLDVRPDGRK